jgi:hypothetical protein
MSHVTSSTFEMLNRKSIRYIVAHQLVTVSSGLSAQKIDGVPIRFKRTHEEWRVGDGTSSKALQYVGMTKLFPDVDLTLEHLRNHE